MVAWVKEAPEVFKTNKARDLVRGIAAWWSATGWKLLRPLVKGQPIIGLQLSWHAPTGKVRVSFVSTREVAAARP